MTTAEMAWDYDPAYSYVIIEHRLGIDGLADFSKIDEALSDLKSKILGQEVVRDPDSGEKRLIIRMKHQETEEIMLAFLGAGLKEKFHCYVY